MCQDVDSDERKEYFPRMKQKSDPQHIGDLKPDKRNARKHNPRNIGMIESSLQELGAGRSILIDEQNNIIAGNGTIEAAASAGITKLQIVDTDGDTIIAVRRSNLTAKQKKRMAVADNRTAELAEWDVDVLGELAGEDLLAGLFSDGELETLLDSFAIDGIEAPELADGDRAPFRQATFTVHDEQWEEIETALAKAKKAGGGESAINENSNGNALAFICGRYIRGKG